MIVSTPHPNHTHTHHTHFKMSLDSFGKALDILTGGETSAPKHACAPPEAMDVRINSTEKDGRTWYQWIVNKLSYCEMDDCKVDLVCKTDPSKNLDWCRGKLESTGEVCMTAKGICHIKK